MKKSKKGISEKYHFLIAAWCHRNDAETRVWLARMAGLQPLNPRCCIIRIGTQLVN